MTIYVRDTGAVADGKTDDTIAMQSAIDTCADQGGGTVIVPAGTYLLKPINLRSHVTLHLEAGAVLKASANREDYRAADPDLNPEFPYEGLVTALDCENVAITGRGTIDGSGFEFVFKDRPKLHEDGGDFDRKYTRQGADFMSGDLPPRAPFFADKPRPGRLVRFLNCKDVLLEGVTIADSPTWTVFLNGCERVRITGVTIHSDTSNARVPNDDGIHLIDCRHTRISDCGIDVGDDAIAVSGGEQISVTNCTLTSRSAGIRIAYNFGSLRDCVLSNLVIHANRGIVINTRNHYSVQNILFDNIVMRTELIPGHWWGKGEPITISAVPLGDETPGPIRGLQFSNIRAESEAGIVIYGTPESRISDVIFDNVHVIVRGGPLQDAMGGNIDLRAVRDIEENLFAHDIPALYARYVDGLIVRECSLRWDDDDSAPYFTHAIHAEHFSDLTIDNFDGRAAQQGLPAIALNDGKGARVRRSHATVQAEDVTGLHQGGRHGGHDHDHGA